MEEKMKKSRLFTLFALIILSLLLLIGCEKEDTVLSLSLKDHDPEGSLETVMGSFDCDSYTVIVTYDSGSTEEIALTEEMISESDLFKFYQEGTHDITISYGDCQYVFKVDVKRAKFEGLKFSDNNVFTYDGTAHTVEIEGYIPANAKITYIGGNSFINAGTYDVTAIISCEGYVTEKLSTTVKVERAKYDMSGVKFESAEFVYDGKSHSIEISGTLPAGVSAPTYTVNGNLVSSIIDADKYTIKAHFANNNPNYENIPDMFATLTIKPAKYDLNVDLTFKNGDGNILTDLQKVYDEKKVTFEINDKSLVGRKINVSYSVTDGNDNPLTDEKGNAITSFTEAGIYTVRMDVTLVDGKNYEEIEPIIRTFEVKKARYDTSEIHFDAYLATYNKSSHKLLVSLPDGHDVKPWDVHYEYRLGNELLQVDPSVGVTEAGEYTVTASFIVRNKNYEDIPAMQAALVIEKQSVDISSVGFYVEGDIEYSGNSYEPNFRTLQQINSSDYDVISYSNRIYYKRDALGNYIQMGDGALPTSAGFYRCVIELSIKGADANNYILQSGEAKSQISFDFEIEKKEVDLSLVKFESYTDIIYSGLQYAPKLNYSVYSNLMTTENERFYQLESNGEYALISSKPSAVGSYRYVITARVLDEENYVLSGDVASTDLICDYEIGIPPSINVSALVELGATPVTYKYNGEDFLPEIKLIVEERIADTLGENKDSVLVRYCNKKTYVVVNEISDVGEYVVLLVSANVLFDGTSYARNVTIMTIVITE